MTRTILKGAVAALLIAGSALGALALNVDQKKIPPVRLFLSQQTHYYRFTVNFNDVFITSGQRIAVLAQNTYIAAFSCHVMTAFNGTTPQLTMGTTLGATDALAATGAGASIDLTSATYQSATSMAGLGLKITSVGDVPLYVRANNAGTATAGTATCVLQFAPPNDM